MNSLEIWKKSQDHNPAPPGVDLGPSMHYKSNLSRKKDGTKRKWVAGIEREIAALQYVTPRE